jgi:hypothetical protein
MTGLPAGGPPFFWSLFPANAVKMGHVQVAQWTLLAWLGVQKQQEQFNVLCILVAQVELHFAGFILNCGDVHARRLLNGREDPLCPTAAALPE